MTGKDRMKLRLLPLCLLLLLLASLSACSYDMEIRGVQMQPYVPAPLPHLFDEAMAAPRHDGVLLAGAQMLDITPYDRKAWLAGFGPGRKSRGVLDPVYAHILYLNDGRNATVLIALDIVGIMNPDVNRLRSLITAKYPHNIQGIATHNHQGPDTIGYWGPGLLIPVDRGVDQDWFDKTMQAIALSVNDAIRTAQPARLAFGDAMVDPQWSSNLWFDHDQGPKDDQLGVLRVETLDGKALATVINWACHAESLLHNNKISADFPGRFYKHCAAKGGGVGIFLANASGGMVTAYPCRWEQRKHYDLEKRIAWADQLGEYLYDTAAASVRDVPRVSGAKINLKHSSLAVPMRNPLFRVAADNGIIRTDDRGHDRKQFNTELNVLDLGPCTFAFVPGEPFPSLGKILKDAMPRSKPPFVVTLANDELAYMMTEEEWNDSHYRYERSMSCGREAGPLVTEALVALIKKGR